MKAKHKRAYMESAEAFAKCSVGTRLKVGCVVVRGGIISEGYNGLPKHLSGALEGVDGCTKPEVIHAEINALKKLTRSHESSVGASIFITHSPCKYCASDIIDAGIVEVYYKHLYRCSAGLDYLSQNGVLVYQMEDL